MEDKKFEKLAKTAGAVFVTDEKGDIAECGTIEFRKDDGIRCYETEVKIINDDRKRKFIGEMYRDDFPVIASGNRGGWRALAIVSPMFEVPPYIAIRALTTLAKNYAKQAESSEPTIAVKPSKVAS